MKLITSYDQTYMQDFLANFEMLGWDWLVTFVWEDSSCTTLRNNMYEAYVTMDNSKNHSCTHDSFISGLSLIVTYHLCDNTDMHNEGYTTQP